MPPHVRTPRRFGLATLLAVCGLTIAGCGGDAGSSADPSPTVITNSSTSPSSTPPASAEPSATATPVADTTAQVTIKAGKVSTAGGAVVKAKAGQKVRIVATSDVAESLHVHGYDKTLDLKPGKSASLEFVADTKGSFEVETHESGDLAFRLQVS
ncbi:hypothetical protein [Kribbella sp. NPDC049227]|uniref:hypothetical protein n=1 Tax=Kribbella sp. NPDC049227 TaxID=3364113 RepID=UPI0037158CAD